MKLPPADVGIFYEIQSSLYGSVNRRRRLFPHLKTTEELQEQVTLEQLDALRQALYDDISLLDEFVAANPDNLPEGHLAIARTWRYFKADTFYIFRYLKKYTVFLDSGDPPRAYGVLGLTSDFDEIIPRRPPIMVEAVLLPFRDKIVFDGILKPYNIYFGGGIRRSLNEAYRLAKERFGILTSLLPEAGEGDVGAANTRGLKAFEKWLLRSGLRPQTVERHVSNVRLFAEKHLARMEPPRTLFDIEPTDVLDYLAKGLPPEAKRKNTIVSFKKFFKFMGDTERMDWETVYEIRETLRGM
jgi:hypothetical protein